MAHINFTVKKLLARTLRNLGVEATKEALVVLMTHKTLDEIMLDWYRSKGKKYQIAIVDDVTPDMDAARKSIAHLGPDVLRLFDEFAKFVLVYAQNSTVPVYRIRRLFYDIASMLRATQYWAQRRKQSIMASLDTEASGIGAADESIEADW